MTYSLVVGAAPATDPGGFYRELLSGAGLVVAADAAGRWCAGLGRIPDILVGDFDSAEALDMVQFETSGVTVEHHPRDKDATDLELAVDAARLRSDQPVCLTAAFSRRIDHTLASLGLLTRAGTGAWIAEPTWRAWACLPSQPFRVQLAPGVTFSVVALQPSEGVTVSGARWALTDASLDALGGRGISNTVSAGDLTVSVGSGALLVIVNDGGV